MSYLQELMVHFQFVLQSTLENCFQLGLEPLQQPQSKLLLFLPELIQLLPRLKFQFLFIMFLQWQVQILRAKQQSLVIRQYYYLPQQQAQLQFLQLPLLVKLLQYLQLLQRQSQSIALLFELIQQVPLQRLPSLLVQPLILVLSRQLQFVLVPKFQLRQQ